MSVKNDFVLPIVVLSLICLFISGSLAYVNTFARPKIEADGELRAISGMKKVIETENFIEFTDVSDIPKEVTRIFAAKNKNGENLGYIFMVTVKGYGGNMNLICGIDNDGKIIRTSVLSHTETKGMTDPVFAEVDPNRYTYRGQYEGKDKNLQGITAVTGATVSSNAYKKGIGLAFDAFEKVKTLNHEVLR